jgi:hypothetical protein
LRDLLGLVPITGDEPERREQSLIGGREEDFEAVSRAGHPVILGVQAEDWRWLTAHRAP